VHVGFCRPYLNDTCRGCVTFAMFSWISSVLNGLHPHASLHEIGGFLAAMHGRQEVVHHKRPRKPQRCQHGRVRYYCRDCGGSQICQHDKYKRNCKACHGGQICAHDRFRKSCRECNKGALCEHGKFRYRCRVCGGNGICVHKKTKSRCRMCSVNTYCVHGKESRYCRVCDGRAWCAHGHHKRYCVECGGSSLCEHKRQRHQCCWCLRGVDPPEPARAVVQLSCDEIEFLVATNYDNKDLLFCVGYIECRGCEGCCRM
jgi:hypothetical protein